MKLPLVITGVGLVSPVGHTGEVAMHAIRCGLSRLEVQRFPDAAGVWVRGGRVLALLPGIRERRLRMLAALALVDAWGKACGAAAADKLGPVAVVLGAPEKERPGYRFPPAHLDLRAWVGRLGLPPGPVEVLPYGHCSVAQTLERAAALIGGGQVRLCLVGAADTQLQLRVIRWHEGAYRLKTSYLTDGLMPGEAACFLAVEEETAARARGARILARVLSVGIAQEPATVLSDLPNAAKGLTAAARTALTDAVIESKDLGMVWGDLNGESYRGREWAFSECRLGMHSYTQLLHPADCHGDLGAASAAMLIGLAALAQASGWAEGRPSLVFTGSEIEGTRAAVVVAPPPTEKPPALPPVTFAVPRAIALPADVSPLGPDEPDFAQSDDPPRTYFDWQMRQEYLDILAALHYQRKGILHNPALPWPRLREPEQRILNHLDAVIAGGPTSIWAVASGLLDGEEGKAFAGALLLGTLPTPANFALMDAALKPATPLLAGIEAGLCHAPTSKALVAHVETWLDHEQPAVRAMAISVLSYRRELDPRRIVLFIQNDDPRVRLAGIRAARRRRYLAAAPALEKLLAGDDPLILHEALLTLLCLGVRNAPERCRQLVVTGSVPAARAPWLLALGGLMPDLFVMMRAEKALEDPVTLSALGVLGNVRAAAYLLQTLDAKDDAVKVAAAEALELIAASGLRETAIVEEREVERVATSAEVWRGWWAKNGKNFDPQRRWRRGRPFDFGVFVAELRDPAAHLPDRQRAYWELLILSGQSFPFEPDWFVPRQQEALAQWESWWAANKPR